MKFDKKLITIDDLMEDFLADSLIEDDEFSDSIFTCVDNTIDDMCEEVIQTEGSMFETDRGDCGIPFSYVIDQVMDKIEDNINTAYNGEPTSFCNDTDPDYIESADFNELDPEDFQLYIPTHIDDPEDEDTFTRQFYGATFDDANFNA